MSIDASVFEQKLQDKLMLIYSARRTQGKAVFDWVDMNDGELLINCGTRTAHQSTALLMQQQGGLTSLLPLLERCVLPH